MATEYWTKLDGTKISVDEMDLNHLRNTLKMIIRNARNKKRKAASKLFELNGEIAQSVIEDNMDDDRCDATEIDIY